MKAIVRDRYGSPDVLLLSIRDGRKLGLMIWWKPFNREDVAFLTELIAAGRTAMRSGPRGCSSLFV